MLASSPVVGGVNCFVCCRQLVAAQAKERFLYHPKTGY